MSRIRLPNIRGPFPAQPISKAFTAVTIARIATLHGLPVGPFSLSTTPVPIRKPRARHERQSRVGRKSGGLPSAARQRRCAPAAICYALLFALRSTFPARQPQTEACCHRRGGRDNRRDSARRSNNSLVRAISAARADSFGKAVRYSRTSILLCKPSIA